MSFFSKTLRTHATYSAFASDAPDFPLAPVYLFTPTPLPKNAELFLSEADAYIGSNPASTSADNIFEFTNTLSNKFGLFISILFKISELGRVDLGGGGTIAYILANKGMDVIDCGVPVLSMHAPYEVTSKFDVYSAYRMYKAFFEN